jgi:hypothetical protein
MSDVLSKQLFFEISEKVEHGRGYPDSEAASIGSRKPRRRRVPLGQISRFLHRVILFDYDVMLVGCQIGSGLAEDIGSRLRSRCRAFQKPCEF